MSLFFAFFGLKCDNLWFLDTNEIDNAEEETRPQDVLGLFEELERYLYVHFSQEV